MKVPRPCEACRVRLKHGCTLQNSCTKVHAFREDQARIALNEHVINTVTRRKKYLHEWR